MFVTRTVAAEVCLEAKTNDAAYNALKKREYPRTPDLVSLISCALLVDRAGDLPFTPSCA